MKVSKDLSSLPSGSTLTDGHNWAVRLSACKAEEKRTVISQCNPDIPNVTVRLTAPDLELCASDFDADVKTAHEPAASFLSRSVSTARYARHIELLEVSLVLAEVTMVSCKGDIASLFLVQSPALMTSEQSSMIDNLAMWWSTKRSDVWIRRGIYSISSN